jgi:hypothetical protein
MSRFEDFLRDALARQDPGPDFTRAVLDRAAALPAPRRWRRFVPLSWLRPAWVAIAVAACLLLVAGGIRINQRHVRAEGEAAKQQVVQALRIAGAKLHMAQAKVFELQSASLGE